MRFTKEGPAGIHIPIFGTKSRLVILSVAKDLKKVARGAVGPLGTEVENIQRSNIINI
jgi:hypothetical protein